MTVWDDEKEEWFFSFVDVVEILTDRKNSKKYINKMCSRDEKLNFNWGKSYPIPSNGCARWKKT